METIEERCGCKDRKIGGKIIEKEKSKIKSE